MHVQVYNIATYSPITCKVSTYNYTHKYAIAILLCIAVVFSYMANYLRLNFIFCAQTLGHILYADELSLNPATAQLPGLSPQSDTSVPKR